MPLISYITSSLGTRDKYILETGQSIANQTLKDVEWVVVSKTTLKNRDKLLKLDIKKIKLIEGVANGVMPRARNIGVCCSDSEYVAFVDDDDTKCPTFGEEMIKEMVKPRQVVVCDMNVIDEESKVIGMHLVGLVEYKDLWTSTCLYFVNEILLSKEAFNKIGGFDENLLASEDYEFYARVLRDLNTYHLSAKLSNYRSHPDSWSNDPVCRGERTHEGMHYMLKKHGGPIPCPRCGEKF